MNHINHRGYFTLLVLVFSAVFFTLISSLAGFIFVEKRVNLAEENRHKALNIAEAGLEYYKWHLAHFPGDLEDGTGQPGPYVHAFQDPEHGVFGTFSLEIEGTTYCQSQNLITITSTGWTATDPSYKRVLVATYARPSVADYSTIVDANVWVGSDRVIQGPYHSNGGIRMDATHNAPVTSGVATWVCTSQFGCSGDETKQGVFGAGSNPELWRYPVPPVDFSGLTTDMVTLKDYARHEGGLYFGPAGGESNNHGYHATFNADGTLSVRDVKDITPVWGYSTDDGWQVEYSIIYDEDPPVTYSIPTSCPVVFFEDRLWIDGVVSGKVTLVSSDVSQPNYDPDTVINGNITYATGSSVDGLTVIAENSILIGLPTPDIMNLHGIFIAQKGRFGRNHYEASGTYAVPPELASFVTRSVLHTTGTVVSKGRVGTKWTSGDPPVFVSGYAERNDTYDRTLAAAPPAFTPSISDDYTFKSWQEQQ